MHRYLHSGSIIIEFDEDGRSFGLTLENLSNFAGNDCEDYGFNEAADLACTFTSAIANGYLDLEESGLAYLAPECCYI